MHYCSPVPFFLCMDPLCCTAVPRFEDATRPQHLAAASGTLWLDGLNLPIRQHSLIHENTGLHSPVREMDITAQA